MNAPLRLVVGFDSSELGHNALWQAIAIANAAAHAEIYVVRAADAPASQAEFAIGAPAMEAALASINEEVQTELKPFSANDHVKIYPAARFGRPSDVVCTAARDLEADYVLVGTHGRKGLSRAVLGSVAELVVRQAPCTVIVVRTREADLVPQVEPTCPTCIQVRAESAGKVLFCNQHPHKGREMHLHYQYAKPFALGSNLIRGE